MPRQPVPVLGKLVLSLGTLALLLGLPLSAASTQIEFGAWIRGPISVLMLTEETELAARIQNPSEAEEFMRWFWERRDPRPETFANESRDQFIERLGFVDKEFADTASSVPGWATARGQVYLLFGPPATTLQSVKRYPIDGAYRALQIWEYPDPIRKGALVRFAFAETRHGVKLVVDRLTSRAATDLRQAMSAARLGLVREAPSVSSDRGAEPALEALPLAGEAGRLADGILAAMRIGLTELRGRAGDDGIAYNLAVYAVPPGRPAASGKRVATVSFALSLDDLREWSDQPLRLAVWLPGDPDAVDRIRVVALPGGREALIPVGPDAPEPGPIPVARQLQVAPIADGTGGVTLAYFGTCSKRHPNAVAHLVTLTGAPAEPLALPGGRLALVAVVEPQD